MDQIGSPNPRFSFGDLVKKVQGETEQTGKKGLKSIVKTAQIARIFTKDEKQKDIPQPPVVSDKHILALLIALRFLHFRLPHIASLSGIKWISNEAIELFVKSSGISAKGDTKEESGETLEGNVGVIGDLELEMLTPEKIDFLSSLLENLVTDNSGTSINVVPSTIEVAAYDSLLQHVTLTKFTFQSNSVYNSNSSSLQNGNQPNKDKHMKEFVENNGSRPLTGPIAQLSGVKMGNIGENDIEDSKESKSTPSRLFKSAIGKAIRKRDGEKNVFQILELLHRDDRWKRLHSSSYSEFWSAHSNQNDFLNPVESSLAIFLFRGSDPLLQSIAATPKLKPIKLSVAIADWRQEFGVWTFREIIVDGKKKKKQLHGVTNKLLFTQKPLASKSFAARCAHRISVTKYRVGIWMKNRLALLFLVTILVLAGVFSINVISSQASGESVTHSADQLLRETHQRVRQRLIAHIQDLYSINRMGKDAYARKELVEVYSAFRENGDLSQCPDSMRAMNTDMGFEFPICLSDEGHFITMLRYYPSIQGAYVGSVDGTFLGAVRKRVLEHKLQPSPNKRQLDNRMVMKTRNLNDHEYAQEYHVLWRAGFHSWASSDGCLRQYSINDTENFARTLQIDPIIDCSFNVWKRNWFVQTVQKGEAMWTEPYQSHGSGEWMITTTYPLFNSTNHVVSVLGVDISLSDISDVLSSLPLVQTKESEAANFGNSRIFIMDSKIGALIASSNVESFLSSLDEGSLGIAIKSRDQVVQTAAQQIQEFFVDLSNVDQFAIIPQSYDPIIAVRPLVDHPHMHVIPHEEKDPQFKKHAGNRSIAIFDSAFHEGGVSLIVVIAIPRNELFGFIRSTFVTTIALLALSFLLASVLGYLLWRKAKRKQFESYSNAKTRTSRSSTLNSEKAVDIVSDKLENQAKDDKTNWTILLFILKICVVFTVVWILWVSESHSKIDQLTVKLTEQIENRVTNEIYHFLHIPKTISQVMQQSTERRTMQFSASLIEDGSQNDAESIFVDYIRNFWSPTERFVYIGTENGLFLGARKMPDDSIQIGVCDALTNFEYHEYGLGNDGKMNRSDPKFLGDKYDPRLRPWYISAQFTPMWSPVYVFVQKDPALGMSLVQKFSANPLDNSTVSGVFGVDANLETISRFLASIRMNDEGVIVAVEKDTLDIVASSDGQVNSKVPDGCTCENDRLAAENAESPLISRIADDLLQEPGTHFIGFDSEQIVLTLDHVIDAGLKWVVAVGIPRQAFYSFFNEKSQVSFMVGLGLFILTTYLATLSIAAATKPTIVAEDDVDLERIAGEPELNYLERLRSDLEDLVRQSEQILEQQGTNDEPNEIKQENDTERVGKANKDVSSPENENVKADIRLYHRARQYIQDSYDNRNVMEILSCELDPDIDAGRKAKFFYYLYTAPFYRALIYLAIWCHLGLALFEAPSLETSNKESIMEYVKKYRSIILACEGFFLFIHLVDLFIVLTTKGLFRTHLTKSGGKHRSIKVIKAIRIAVLAFLCFDWIYRTFSGGTCFWCVHADLLIPLSAIIRPVLLVLRHSGIRNAFKHFFATLMLAKDVFTLFSCFIAIATLSGMALFRGRLDSDFYVDIRQALFTSFVLISTGENIGDLVEEASEFDLWQTRFYKLYFSLFQLIGMFLIVSLIVAVFQRKYTERHNRRRMKKLRKQRLGSIIAFIILDRNKDCVLHPHEYRDFFAFCGTGVDLSIMGQTKLNIKEFVEIIEKLVPRFQHNGFVSTPKIAPVAHNPVSVDRENDRRRSLHRDASIDSITGYVKDCSDEEKHEQIKSQSGKKSIATRTVEQSSSLQSSKVQNSNCRSSVLDFSSLGQLLQKLQSASNDEIEFSKTVSRRFRKWKIVGRKKWRKAIESSLMHSCIQLVLLLQMWLLALYGTHDDVEQLDRMLSVVMFIQAIDIGQRVVLFGLNRYWNHPKYHFQHRFDGIVVGIGFVGWLVGIVIHSSQVDTLLFSLGVEANPMRFFLAIPILRVLTVLDNVKHLLQNLFTILPRFTSIGVLLLLVLYNFAIVGCQLFGYGFYNLPETILETKEINFDSFESSMALLIQFLAGDYEMYLQASVVVTGGSSAIYFFLYVTIVILLFTNLFVGIVIDAFHRFEKISSTKKISRIDLQAALWDAQME